MKLLTVKQAAERAAVHSDTIRRAIHRGDLHAYTPLGLRAIRIDEDDLYTWIGSQRDGRAGVIKQPPQAPRQVAQKGMRRFADLVAKDAKKDNDHWRNQTGPYRQLFTDKGET